MEKPYELCIKDRADRCQSNKMQLKPSTNSERRTVMHLMYLYGGFAGGKLPAGDEFILIRNGKLGAESAAHRFLMVLGSVLILKRE